MLRNKPSRQKVQMILTWGSALPSRRRSVRVWRSSVSCRGAQARRGCGAGAGGTRADAGARGTCSLRTPDSGGAVAEGWSASATPLH